MLIVPSNYVRYSGIVSLVELVLVNQFLTKVVLFYKACMPVVLNEHKMAAAFWLTTSVAHCLQGGLCFLEYRNNQKFFVS